MVRFSCFGEAQPQRAGRSCYTIWAEPHQEARPRPYTFAATPWRYSALHTGAFGATAHNNAHFSNRYASAIMCAGMPVARRWPSV